MATEIEQLRQEAEALKNQIRVSGGNAPPPGRRVNFYDL